MSRFNQKGVAHLLLLILLIAGIGLGVYLIGQKTNLFPHAASDPISGPVSTVTTGTVSGPSTALLGQAFQSSFTIQNPTSTNWIGLYKQGATDQQYKQWIFTSNCTQKEAKFVRTAGNCSFNIPISYETGNYEIRMFRNQYDKMATSTTFNVTASTSSGKVSVVTFPQPFKAGDGLPVHFEVTNPRTLDWIGLYKVGDTDRQYKVWIHTATCTQYPNNTVKTSGVCPLNIPMNIVPGTYEVRLFSHDGYNKIATSNSFAVNP